MSKAEKYIEDNTKLYSNISADRTMTSWLTPDQARRAVEIARGEIYEWLLSNAHNYCFGTRNFEARRCIYDLKQAMKNE